MYVACGLIMLSDAAPGGDGQMQHNAGDVNKMSLDMPVDDWQNQRVGRQKRGDGSDYESSGGPFSVEISI